MNQITAKTIVVRERDAGTPFSDVTRVISVQGNPKIELIHRKKGERYLRIELGEKDVILLTTHNSFTFDDSSPRTMSVVTHPDFINVITDDELHDTHHLLCRTIASLISLHVNLILPDFPKDRIVEIDAKGYNS